MSEQLRVLEKDVGTWDAAVEIRMAPDAAPQRSAGVAVNRLVAGGLWLVTDFKNNSGFEGHGVYGWDEARRCYTGVWVDPMRTFLAVGDGRWDEARRTMTYHFERNGQRWRETTETVDDDTRVFRSFLPLPDGHEHEAMTVTYKRRR